jgi:hypothetical protein
MRRTLITAAFILGSILAAWLRFDMGSMLASWVVMMVCIAGTLTGWVRQAKHAPTITLPPECEALSNKDEFTAEEEARFTNALKAWHAEQQRNAHLDILRRGPGSLIGPRATILYFWLSTLTLALLPPNAVHIGLMPGLPRFAVVLLPLGLVAVAVAAPLGLRDWARVRRSVEADRRASG